MKKFVDPAMDIEKLEIEDVISTSIEECLDDCDNEMPIS